MPRFAANLSMLFTEQAFAFYIRAQPHGTQLFNQTQGDMAFTHGGDAMGDGQKRCGYGAERR